jgi:hypothetical protein
MGKYIQRDDVSHEVTDDGGLLFGVEKAKNGIITAHIRVFARVIIDGQQYEVDRNIRVRLKKTK